MSDALIEFWKQSLPENLADRLAGPIKSIETGDFLALLQHPLAETLLDKKGSTDELPSPDSSDWPASISKRVEHVLNNRRGEGSDARLDQHILFLVAIAALLSFLQSNATGPPLSFSTAEVVFPKSPADSSSSVASLRRQVIHALSVDGEAAYKLTPNVELLSLAKIILSSASLLDHVSAGRWAKLRVDFVHQRLLSEVAPSLQRSIYDNLALVDAQILDTASEASSDSAKVSFLLERASIHTHHGLEMEAREDIEQATRLRKFDFVLTGLLGKRTKFQQQDLSQLVVLAKSSGSDAEGSGDAKGIEQTQPKKLDLNDETLLEAISFAETPQEPSAGPQPTIPQPLSALDPENQPILHPLDSIILLSLALSITNTAPGDGLTREETLPYATRVLQGGSSNWQVYTQALLVRSRIEGYSSRTVERGLLQFQTVVDQVIADTTDQSSPDPVATTFLPRAENTESAPVHERLQYIFPLCAPLRWGLEAELASRWVNLGGLKTALEIYERLEMWAEVALCWAGTEQEDKAKRVVRRQLFHPTKGPGAEVDEEQEEWHGPELSPPPDDAPRLYCILGDIDHDAAMYEKAWEVSNQRYARAQRSLGRLYLAAGDQVKAASAYSKSLKVNPLNHSSWFALGCALLELQQFDRAVETFSRAVQLDDTDGESWSNLAAALLHQDPARSESNAEEQALSMLDDEGTLSQPAVKDPQQSRKDALKALKHAARLRFESYRIWDNLLTVAASLSPPAYHDMVAAQKHIIELRGKTDGEKCVDENIIDILIRHVLTSDVESHPKTESAEPDHGRGQHGIQRMVFDLIDRDVVPLITSSSRLWLAVSRLALWRGRPGTALEASEKAWRVVVGQPGWEHGNEARWDHVVDATVELVDAYENIGPREKTEGLAAGSGELVAKDWKFKGRSAIRGIKGRGKENWEDTKGWERLNMALEGLK